MFFRGRRVADEVREPAAKAGPTTCHTSWAPAWIVAGLVALVLAGAGCHSADFYRHQADDVATNLIVQLRAKTVGKQAPFTIEQPADTLRRRLLVDQHLPGSSGETNGQAQVLSLATGKALHLTLDEALQVGARNNRAYQNSKESIFIAALALDLERVKLGNLYGGLLSSIYTEDRSGNGTVRGVENNATAKMTRKFSTGAAFTGKLALNLVKLLTLDSSSAFGLLAEVSLSVPLLRGAGRKVVLEPLTQAEQDVVYAIYEFERYKSMYAVDIAGSYLAVLQQSRKLKTVDDSHTRLLANWRQARKLADAGRLPEIQVDQAKQAELLALNHQLDAKANLEAVLDGLKIKLGLPTDARVELDPQEFANLTAIASRLPTGTETKSTAETSPGLATGLALQVGPHLVTTEEAALKLALARRLDLKEAAGMVADARRAVDVARDALRADLKLTGSSTVGEARSLSATAQSNARFSPASGTYTAGLEMDLPWERTKERNDYRNSLIALERATRTQQETEDKIKQDVRLDFRNLQSVRTAYLIQGEALRLATRRVESTQLFMQAGRAQMRDVLDAQDSLVTAQNAMNAALISCRVTELQLQRDMEVLDVDEEGLLREY